MDKKAVEVTIQTLEDIKGSVEFYERDKPEFVKALQQGIQALESVAKLQKEKAELEKKLQVAINTSGKGKKAY